MVRIGVLDGPSEGLYRELVRSFSALSAGDRKADNHSGAAHPAVTVLPAADFAEPPDILALAPDGDAAAAAALPARILVAPGDTAAAYAGRIRARRVVTYGPSARDTVTLSAAERERVTIAVQREIRTVDGGRAGRQELELAAPAPLPLTEACSAVLLTAGVPAELIARAFGTGPV